jgi:hypothetical protein
MKFCRNCKIVITNVNTNKNKRYEDGLETRCRECSIESDKQYRIRKGVFPRAKGLHDAHVKKYLKHNYFVVYCEKNKKHIQEYAIRYHKAKNSKKRNNYKELKEQIIKDLGGKCTICNGVFHSAAFDFHHINPKEKDHSIRHLMWRKKTTRDEELKKCILICSNCHRELHAKYHEERRKV